jgi:signal transduction histidine kinase
MRPPYARNCFVPQLFALPQASLMPGTNVLHLQVVGYPLRQIAAAQRSSGLSEVRLGPMRQLQPLHADATFLRVTLARIMATILLVFALLFVSLWLMRRKDSFYGWFGLWIAWWGLNATRPFVTSPLLPSPLIEALVVTTVPLALAGLVLFKLRYCGVRWRWVDRALLAQVVLVPLLVVGLGLERLNLFARIYYLVAVVQYLVVSVWFARRAWSQSRRDFWMFVIGDVMVALLAVVEYASGYLGYALKLQLSPLAGPVTLLPVALRLLWLMAESLSRSEQLNAELEHRVAEKSAEIERSYDELADLRAREAALRERQRIAADLHDDLGARLLSLAHASSQADDQGRLASMARQALDEMRLSVRGLLSEPLHASDVLADWRSESVQRLAAAGFTVDWHAHGPDVEVLLPARTQVQLTRVLRESLSNVIRHSGGRHCRVGIAVDAAGVSLSVEDDGRGFDPGLAAAGGIGLAGIERRVRTLAGRQSWQRSTLGGAWLAVWVPLGEGGAAPAPDAVREAAPAADLPLAVPK